MSTCRPALALAACLLGLADARADLSFQSRTDRAAPPAASGPVSVAVADFYGQDGVPDVAVSYEASDRVIVFANDGTATFSVRDVLMAPVPDLTPQASNVGDAPSGIAAADIDGDTLPDLVGVNSVTARFIAFVNETDLGLGWRVADPQADRGSGFDLAATRWSNPPDGFVDLVMASDASVRIGLGNGDGTFNAVNIFTRADIGNLLDIEVGDFLAVDPITDVLTVDGTNRKLIIWPGDPAFQGALLTSDSDVVSIFPQVAGSPVTPFEAVVGDFDASDPRPDFLVGTTEGYVLLYASQAGATPYASPVVTDVVGPLGDGARMPSRMNGLVLADMDGDGVDDLVVSDAGSRTLADGFNWLSVVFGCTSAPPVFDPDGQTCGREPLHHAAADLRYPMAGGLSVDDFDGAGGPDVLLLNGDAGSFTVFANDGTGALDAARSFSVGGREARGADAGRIDADAAADLVVGLYGEQTVALLRGDGQGGFARGVKLAAPAGLVQPTSVLVEAWTDGVDATLDVLTGFATDHALWQGTGTGAFAAPARTSIGGGSARTGNLGGSASLDVAMVQAATETARVWVGDGSGGFLGGASFPGVYAYRDHVVGRFFGSSRDDVVITGAESVGPLARHGFHVIPHVAATDTHGPMTFVAFEDIDPVLVDLRLTLLAEGDVDRNGSIDIVGITSAGEAYVFLGDGVSFTWDTRQAPVTLGLGPRALLVQDLNGDGVLDLAAATASSVGVAEGMSGGLFATPVQLPTNIDNSALVVADADADGREDLIVASWRTSDVTVLLNTSPRRLHLFVEDRADGLPGPDPVVVTWTDVGAGTLFDVLRGDVALMHANRDTRDATCWLSDVAALEAVDPDPPVFQPGNTYGAFYYLAKCQGLQCSDPTFGTDSRGGARVTPADCP